MSKVLIVCVDDKGDIETKVLDEEINARMVELLIQLSTTKDEYHDATMPGLIEDLLDDVVDVWINEL